MILKRHAPTVLDLSQDELVAVMQHAQKIAHAVVDVMDAAGLNVFQNNGVSAGQTVAHYHVHVLPSHRGDDPSKFIRPEERVYLPIDERSQLAAQIASQLQQQRNR